MGDSNIELLRSQFMTDWGVVRSTAKRRYHVAKPVLIDSNPWVFTLRAIRSPADMTWVALNSDMVPSRSTSAVVANDMTTAATMAALIVAAVNGTPLFKVMNVRIDDTEYATITDQLNPPDRIKYAAAALFLTMIRTAEYGQEMVEFIQQEFRIHLDVTPVVMPKPDDRPDHAFKCGTCHFDWVFPHDKMERLESVIEAKGGLICPSCGDVTAEAKPSREESGPFNPPGGAS